jgi:hypothetical protein
MRNIATFVIILFLIVSPHLAAAGTDDNTTPDPKLTPPALANSKDSAVPTGRSDERGAIESELQDLRNLVQSQSEELHELRARLTAVEAGNATPKSAPVSAIIPDVSTQPNEMALSAGSGQKESNPPLSFKIGSAQFTPGGFLDLAAYYRSTNLGSGIATAFGAIPFNNQLPQGRLSETHFSAQYSRLSLKVDANLNDSTALTGYVETDFLGFQPANAYQTSNSDSLRLRLFWADVRHGKWEVLAGQGWSLLTPNRVGLSPLTGDVFVTLNEDPNFQVGLTWARQPLVRVVYHPTSNWALGVSLENPQQFAPSSVVFPSPFFTSQFDNGSGSTSAASSATNTAVPDRYPDIIAKVAFDARPAGRALHIEAAGLLRGFRVLNNLVTPNANNTITGGGGSLNLNYEVIRNLHLIANTFYSDGGGRYIFGLGPDVIVKPNGTLSGVHAGSGVGGFEYQATRQFMFYGYYGGAYFQRNFGFLPAPTTSSCEGVSSFSCVGFGFPGSANTSNRAVQEGTFGVIHTLWSNENYGRVQIITQYSYLTRSPWSVLMTPEPSPSTAHANLAYIDFRYTLP